MTYCIGMRLDRGLMFMSDTRTNAGVDNVSVFRKLVSWSTPGERALTLLCAGNLATTQATISILDERTKAASERAPSILEVPSMFQAARLVGGVLRDVIKAHADTGQKADAAFNATLILGGQIRGTAPRMFLIYPEGNFIEASADTPFFQIGETKYGRPILVRAYDPAMSFDAALKLFMVSFDSTIKANLSVGLPLDFQIYPTDSFTTAPVHRIAADDPTFQAISVGWGEALRGALASLPDPSVPV